MKKLFTLLGAVLMASTSFGQTNWTSIIVNGDCEGNAPAYDDASKVTAEAWNSFWVHEWPGDQSARYDGTANIVVDPTDPSNHCVKVVVRSRAEGEAAGNLTPDYTGNAGTYGSWDCQFFIYATQPIPAGKELRLQMRVRAERAGKFETQAHSTPGAYIDANAFGNPEYTTEWKTLKLDPIVVSSSQAEGGFQSIAFNLCTDEDANVLYLDDIKLQMRDPKQGGESSWINFMRKGVDSDDPIGEVNYGSDSIPNMVKISNFMIQVRDNDLNQNILVKAPVVDLEDGKRAVKVPTLNHYSKQIEDLDENGNQQFDEDGEVKMRTRYFWEHGDTIGTRAPSRYSSQFFASTLHKMKAGEKYRFAFWAKADKPAAIGTQAHTMPTKYAGWDTFGGTGDFQLGTEWKRFELGSFDSVEDAAKKVIPSGANGCQTITFDLYDLQEANNYYFIFEECSFTEDNVTIADRTLGTPQDIALPVNSGEEEKATTIDAAPMLKAFEVENFDFLNNGKDGIKLYTMIEPDDPEDDPTPSFSSMLTLSDGGFVNAKGLYIDDDQGIQLFFDPESIDGSKINIMVWNNPDAGIVFGDGKTVQTKLAFSQSGWYYIYNITLMSEADYAGIKDVEVAKKNNNVIYDLMGRKVNNPSKGLYIVNGKKYFIK